MWVYFKSVYMVVVSRMLRYKSGLWVKKMGLKNGMFDRSGMLSCGIEGGLILM